MSNGNNIVRMHTATIRTEFGTDKAWVMSDVGQIICPRIIRSLMGELLFKLPDNKKVKGGAKTPHSYQGYFEDEVKAEFAYEGFEDCELPEGILQRIVDGSNTERFRLHRACVDEDCSTELKFGFALDDPKNPMEKREMVSLMARRMALKFDEEFASKANRNDFNNTWWRATADNGERVDFMYMEYTDLIIPIAVMRQIQNERK